jgi:hypothetical protein
MCSLNLQNVFSCHLYRMRARRPTLNCARKCQASKVGPHVTSSYTLCHIILHTMSHHHAHYVMEVLSEGWGKMKWVSVVICHIINISYLAHDMIAMLASMRQDEAGFCWCHMSRLRVCVSIGSRLGFCQVSVVICHICVSIGFRLGFLFVMGTSVSA